MSRRATRRQAMRIAGGAAAAGIFATLGGDAAVESLPVVARGATTVGAPSGGDDGPVIQAVHDQLAHAGGGTLTFQPGATYRLDTGVVIDPVRVGVLGDRTTLDASRLRGGTAVTLTGSRREPGVYATPARGFLIGVEIAGPGDRSATRGLETIGSSAGYTAGMACYGTAVHDFGVGVSIGSYSYINDFFNLAVYSCHQGVDDTRNKADAGERITFVGSAVFNCGTGLHLRVPPSDYAFLACSFDYNAQFASIGGVHCSLAACHVEMPTSNAARHLELVAAAATTFTMHGGMWAQTGGGASTGPPVTTAAADTGSLAAFYGVAFSGVVTAGRRFAGGAGATSVLNPLPDAASSATDFGPAVVGRGNQSVVAGAGPLRPDAATGHLHIPTISGPPTHPPAGVPGTVAMAYDTASGRLWVYHERWQAL